MLTPTDHARLLSLTTHEVLTPDDAQFIHKCMPANSWLTSHDIRWWYPISDTGYGVPEGVRYDQPIRKPHGPRLSNPTSLEQQQPWVPLNICRTTYFTRLARARLYAVPLSQLPSWVGEAEGLKLYALFSSLSRAHKLDIKGLWGEVCSILNKMSS